MQNTGKRIQKLLQRKTQWDKEKGLIDYQEWVETGIDIYRRLHNNFPDSVEYKKTLAKLYLEYGNDLKLKMENYRTAREYFEELLDIEPSAEVYYRLGYIEAFEHNWNLAIEKFSEVLKFKDNDPHFITMSLINLALAYHQVGNYPGAKQYWDKAKEFDQDKQYVSFLELVKMQIGEKDQKAFHQEPYIMFTTGDKESYLASAELNRIGAMLDDDYIYLHIKAHQRVLFKGTSGGPFQIPYVYALILECLMRSSEPVEYSTIREYLKVKGDINVEESSIKTYVKRVRDEIQHGFDVPINQILITAKKRCYQWNCNLPYRIIRPVITQ